MKPSFLGLDLGRTQYSDHATTERRALITNLLDAFVTAVCGYPEFLSVSGGLIVRCDLTVFAERPHTRLRAWAWDNVQLPITCEYARAFAAWSGGLRACAETKGFRVGTIYWLKGVENIELVQDVPVLAGVNGVSDLRIESVTPQLSNMARSVVRFLFGRDDLGEPQ